MKSPLADLTEILTRVREDSQRYADTLAVNEASTRAVLIDPILRALGWDTGDPNMVEVEKTFQKARADYALLDINQEVKAIVEAKCLGASLKDKDVFLSLVNYAFSAGVQDIFLTDGVTWLHFSDFKPGNSEPTKELSLLDEENLVEIAS